MTDHQHIADVLNRAADMIQRHGWESNKAAEPTWSQGWYTGEDAPLCLEGGIQAALGIHVHLLDDGEDAVVSCPAYRAVVAHLAISDADGRLWRWNDAPGRTAAEVIEVLRATAVIEQARADEHTATDTGYDSAAAMLSVAGDAAARTLATIR